MELSSIIKSVELAKRTSPSFNELRRKLEAIGASFTSRYGGEFLKLDGVQVSSTAGGMMLIDAWLRKAKNKLDGGER